MTDHPLFDFGESKQVQHDEELQKAFMVAYQSYINQGGRIYGL